MTTRADVAATVLALPDGRDLAFADYGDPDGAPVFAFHGTPGSRLQLAPMSDLAREAGVRLIVPDRPGYGHSSLASGRCLADWPADVAAIADHLGLERFAVVGISGGGPHALACGCGLPGRVASVTAVSSPSPEPVEPGRFSPGAVRWIRRLVALPGLVVLVMTVLLAAARRFPLAALRLARRSMPPSDRRVVDDPEVRAWYLDAGRHDAATTARAAAQDVRLFTGDWHLDLAGIVPPVTIWHGTDDRLVEPWNAKVLAAAIPGATLELVPDEGHLLFADIAGRVLADLARAHRASL